MPLISTWCENSPTIDTGDQEALPGFHDHGVDANLTGPSRLPLRAGSARP